MAAEDIGLNVTILIIVAATLICILLLVYYMSKERRKINAFLEGINTQLFATS